ncbi:hypothetical protein HLH44_15305 [Gluconacetobacter sp. 1c LMG 22058]|uniref:Uncharacterized protein n=1 Tax=Gluconacetobacter dulcium TaxID=2729096 RepID=A0A7W4PIM0_9PROT|nr:hypothetical protein [Gluconacetobacter dulcium]MBB2198803.1 hypothetical protein [Gluconacetobacter dulcium]
MLNNLFRVMLSLTSVCPIFISLAYVEYFRECHFYMALFFIVLFFVIVLLARTIINLSKKKLEIIPISIKKAKSTDKEVISFCASYALPVIFRSNSVSDLQSWLVAASILFFVLLMTNAMPANPVLGVLGYHFYEVDSDAGMGYVLITKKQITHIRQITKVVQIGEYGILEA